MEEVIDVHCKMIATEVAFEDVVVNIPVCFVSNNGTIVNIPLFGDS
jgi:hypothetical protein